MSPSLTHCLRLRASRLEHHQVIAFIGYIKKGLAFYVCTLDFLQEHGLSMTGSMFKVNCDYTVYYYFGSKNYLHS